MPPTKASLLYPFLRVWYIFRNLERSAVDLLTLMKKKGMIRTAGLMTGTSMDGLDICVADVDLTPKGLNYSVLYSESVPFPHELKNRIQQNLTGSVPQMCALNYDLGRFYAEEVDKSLKKHHVLSLDLIGTHGQTLHHISGHSTLQIGEPAFLAERLRVPVVSDFRAADIAAGGTGAPLIPAVDMWLFQQEKRGRVLLNIGGVANITLLPPASSHLPVLGFDTGPGMGLLDERFQQLFDGSYDKDGNIASQGTINTEVLNQWEKHPFIQKNPPKSTGRDEFGLQWLAEHKNDLEKMDPPSQLATLAAFTADTIANSILNHKNVYEISELLASGGGSKHPLVMKILVEKLQSIHIRSVKEMGVDPDSKEALGFAILAVACIRNIPGNIPSVTGAKRRVVLGKITPVSHEDK
ncbi:MAG: anhydro-N-acetylmuramic acid kinase [Candidatus Marinimicrobia bacterium]|nr:anhydro-N-acetylmuramic acid kinase [Candidatus Neomarinimicrobiota bacterium]